MRRAMSRLAHHIFKACCVLSLLLLAVVIALWLRSYGLSDQLAWRHVDGEGKVWSARGGVMVSLNLMDLSDGGTRPVDLRPLYHRITAARDTEGRGWWLLARGGNRGDQTVRFERAGFALFEV